MSSETSTWLNSNTLIGFTTKRGHAWHWRAQEQGEQSNHYTRAIPLTDVQDRLFHWRAQSRQVAVEVGCDPADMTHLDVTARPQGGLSSTVGMPIAADLTEAVLGIFGHGYARHQYQEWLPTHGRGPSR